MTSCPTSDQLRNWLGESLPGPQGTALAAHVDDCAACQATLDALLALSVPSGARRTETLPLNGPARDRGFVQKLQAVRTAGKADEGAGPPAGSLPDAELAQRPIVPGYEVLEQLGRGGMGVVYRARHIRLNRLVALKLLHAARRLEPDDRVRLRNEAEAAARLRHPNIVQIHDTGECDLGPFVAMELVPGGSLADYTRGAPQPARESAELVARLARAIHHAHEQGVIHRDLKPANILLDSGLQRPKVADFGLVRWLDRDTQQTPTGVILGTPSYMAPELSGGGTGPRPTADVYGLGAVLYDLLTGRPPFRGETVLDTLVQVLHEEPIPPRRLRPGVSRDLETICLKCVHKDPDRRYASAAALADDLDRFLAGRPILARPVGPLERGWRWARRNAAVAGLAAALGVAVVAGFTGVTWKWIETERLRGVAVEEGAAKERALGEVRTNLYFHSMALAHRELLANNVADAERLLDDQPPERRGWEWHYLKRLCHPEIRVFRHPSMMFNAIGFSPDGHHLIVSNPTGHVEVRPADGESVPHVLAGTSFWAGRVEGGSTTVRTKDGRDLISWDVATGKEVSRRQLVRPDRSPVLGYSANGKRFATASPRGAVTIWDAGTGTEVCTIERAIHPEQMRLGPTHWMTMADFSPEGDRLAIPSDKVVRIFDTGTGREVQTVGDGKSFIWRVAFRPDGGAVAAGRQNGTAVIWDTATGREMCTLHGHTNFVRGVAFSPNGDRLATCSHDKTVRIWDAKSGDELATYRGHTQGVQSVAFSPDGQQLASTGQDFTVRIWDATSDARSLTLGDSQAEVRAIVACPDGRNLLGLCADGALVTWDIQTGKLVDRRPLTGPVAAPMRVAFRADGRLCAITTGRKTVQIWDVAQGTQACPELPHGDEVFCLAFSPDGNSLATGGRDRTVRIWDIATGRPRTDLGKHSREIRALEYLPDGNRLAIVTWEGAVRVWSLAGPRVAASYSEVRRKVVAIAPAADGRSFVLGSEDGQLVGWNPEDDSEVTLALRAGDNLMSLCASPDGQRLAAAVDSTTVRMWDPATGHECIALRQNGHKVLRVFFSPDGSRLVTLDSRGTVKVYSANSG